MAYDVKNYMWCQEWHVELRITYGVKNDLWSHVWQMISEVACGSQEWHDMKNYMMSRMTWGLKMTYGADNLVLMRRRFLQVHQHFKSEFALLASAASGDHRSAIPLSSFAPPCIASWRPTHKVNIRRVRSSYVEFHEGIRQAQFQIYAALYSFFKKIVN